MRLSSGRKGQLLLTNALSGFRSSLEQLKQAREYIEAQQAQNEEVINQLQAQNSCLETDRLSAIHVASKIREILGQ
jgi:hypothetical protein